MNLELNISQVTLSVGNVMRAFRKREKYSQQELADELSLSRITIQNLESGKNFTIETLLKVLKHFDLMHEFHQFFQALEANLEPKSLY